MAKPNIKKTQEFFANDIWHVNLESFPRWQRASIRLLRMVILGIKGYNEKNLGLRATALTLYTLLSVVPVIAMIFGIAQGFGLEEYLTSELREAFANQPEVLGNLLTYSHNMLSNTRGGLLAGLGFVLLIWSVVQVLSNIENAFNSIWYVKKERTWVRKFTDYLSIMLVAPLFIILSGSANIFISTELNNFANDLAFLGGFVQNLIVISINFIPYLTTSVLFFLIYIVMPNTRIKPRAALTAGIIAGCSFQVFQWVYITFQVGVSRSNAIYGSFASIPLFITWLQFSWIIVLVGAEISYCMQNVVHFAGQKQTMHISHKMRMLFSLHLMHYIALRFKKGETAPNQEELSVRLSIPASLCKALLDNLVKCRLLSEVSTPDKNKEHSYVPALDVSHLQIGFIVNKLESLGELKQQPADTDAMHRLKTLYNELEHAMMHAPSNRNITEL